MRGPSWRLIILFLAASPACLRAQDSGSVKRQIWPEVDVYYRFNERFRLFLQLTGTEANSEYTDGTVGAYVDYFAFPWLRDKLNPELYDSTGGYYWWFRLGYSYSSAPAGEPKKVVNILETESNNSFDLPAKIILETRNRFDWRFVNGDFQPIYRPRAKFVRNLKTDYLTFNIYLYGEYYFYLNDHSDDRFRLCLGYVVKVLKWLDLETYFLHQFPNSPKVSQLEAIGFKLDMYFNSKQPAK